MAKSKPSKSVPAKNGWLAQPLSAFDVLTLSEAAAYLRLSEDAIRAEAEAGRLRGRNVKGEWRFVRSGIVAWLQTSPQTSVTMLESFPRIEETPEEYEALMASIRAYRDETDRATGHGKYAAG